MTISASWFGQRPIGRPGARTAAVAAVALSAATLMALPTAAQGAPVPVPVSAVRIDVANPERGITDPLVGMRPLARDCKPGQVDVNSAAAAEISAVLGVPSSPTVDRIVAARPWHRATDLVSVPGIGPSRLTDLRVMACAEPSELPPPAPLACPPSGLPVDLQVASARDITSRLKFPPAVAQALVDARPLPQDLSQVATPGIPGLSDPRIAELVAAGAVCVTPAPFVHEGRTWRWAYPSRGVVAASADDSRYALVVPPGRVSAPNGAWASVEPRGTATGQVPRADLHIHGPWTGEVGARLPAATAGGSSSPGAPAVMHERDDGTVAFSWGASVAMGTSETGGETVLAPMTTLSEASALDLSPLCGSQLPGGPMPSDRGSLLCAGDSPRDVDASTLAAQRGAFVGRLVAAAPERGPCPTFERAVSSGKLTLGLICGTDLAGTTATWTISNVTAGETLGGIATMYGAVIAQESLDPGRHSKGAPVIDGYGPLGQVLAREIVGRSDFILPQTGVTISKSKGSGPSRFVHEGADAEQWGAFWALFNVSSVFDGAIAASGLGKGVVGDLSSAMASCSVGLLMQMPEDLGDISGCVISVAVLKLEHAALVAESLDNPAAASKVRSASALLKKASWALMGIDAGASYLMQLGAVVTRGELVLDHLPDPLRDTRPPQPTEGDRTFIARTGEGAGYLVDPETRRARHIVSRGDYLCYASSRFVRDYVTLYTDGNGDTALNLDTPTVISDEDAPPCPPQASTWTYSPQPAGNVPAGVILRGQEGGPVTSSWLINSRGEIQTILDGGTYICLVAQYPVVWNVPADKIDAWRPVGTAPAACP